jgi:hypothetical protein
VDVLRRLNFGTVVELGFRVADRRIRSRRGLLATASTTVRQPELTFSPEVN